MAKDYWGRISRENDKSFEEMQDQLYMEHHYHPTYIPHYSTSKSEDARTAEFDAQAVQLAKQGKGKQFINGLPGTISSESFVCGSGFTRPGSSSCIGFVVGIAVLTMVIMILFAVMANTGGL